MITLGLEYLYRYIDDVIILWRGTEDGLEEYLEEINNNKYHISFSGGWNPKQTHFLDVVVYLQADQIYTHTFFKEMDHNGYIPTHSSHHPRCLWGILKGSGVAWVASNRGKANNLHPPNLRTLPL